MYTNRKIQFGSGSNILDGWENTDVHNCDITNPLPFPDSCASFLYASHVIEHVTHRQAWNFLMECKRILKVGGVLRIAIPDISRMERLMTQAYRDAVKAGGHGDDPIRAAIFEHGHMAAWNQDLLITMLQACGFSAQAVTLNESDSFELCDIDRHGSVVGNEIAYVETSCAEGTKC